MSNPTTFMANYTAAVQNLINAIEAANNLAVMSNTDTTIFPGYFTKPGARTDINQSDCTACNGAIQQIFFTYNSGSPLTETLLRKISMP